MKRRMSATSGINDQPRGASAFPFDHPLRKQMFDDYTFFEPISAPSEALQAFDEFEEICAVTGREVPYPFLALFAWKRDTGHMQVG